MTVATWRPEGEFTVYAVHALREQLMTALQASPWLDVDLSEVAEFDGAGLQLLLSARHEAEARGGRLRLLAVSPALPAVLGPAGLQHLLNTEPEDAGTP